MLDEKGKLKIDKAGPRSTIAGAGIGLILAMLTPVGLAVGIIGGGILGALHHKRMWISDADRERIGRELTGGKAAVGVVTDKTSVAAISAALADLGGVPESHELDDAALAELDAALQPPRRPIRQGCLRRHATFGRLENGHPGMLTRGDA